MFNSYVAEIDKSARRPAIWILIAVGTFLSVMFNYGTPYIAYTTAGSSDFSAGQGEALAPMLPEQMLAGTIASFPLFAGAVALVLGVLVMGSEYNWGTVKTILVQRPGRLRVLSGKLLVLAVVVFAFMLAVFVVNAVSSYTVAALENAPMNWPSVWDVLVTGGAGWLILIVWAAFGAMLATLFRGTSLAVGLGLVYLLLVEGLFDIGGQSSDLLATLSAALPRSNAGSLAAALIPPSSGVSGPGIEATVRSTQATLVLAAYLIAFVLLTGMVFLKRDVT